MVLDLSSYAEGDAGYKRPSLIFCVESLRLYGQAIKRTWWMPWQLEAKKDVVDCEKLRGAVKQALIRRYPNGETHLVYQVSISEYIAY